MFNIAIVHMRRLGNTAAWTVAWWGRTQLRHHATPRPPLAKDIHEPADLDDIYAPVSAYAQLQIACKEVMKGKSCEKWAECSIRENKERSILEGIDEHLVLWLLVHGHPSSARAC